MRLLGAPSWWHSYRQRAWEPTEVTGTGAHGGKTTEDVVLRGTLTSAGEKPQSKTSSTQCLKTNFS